MQDINMENEFETDLYRLISKLYMKGDSSQFLYSYILARYMVINGIKNIDKITIEDISRFIISELGIIPQNDYFFYKNTKFYINDPFKQSVSNILINNNFFQEIFLFNNNEIKRHISSEVTPIIDKARTKSYKIRKKYRQYLYYKYALEILNKNYGAEVNSPLVPSYIKPTVFKFTFEEKADIMLHDMSYDTDDFSVVAEKDVEDYIYFNMKKFIPDAIYWKRQMDIGEGNIIDLFVKTNKENIIIEIKNKSDDRLVWQIIKYHDTFGKNVKVYTVAPQYKNGMIQTIKKIPYATPYLYTLNIKKHKITSLKLKEA